VISMYTNTDLDSLTADVRNIAKVRGSAVFNSFWPNFEEKVEEVEAVINTESAQKPFDDLVLWANKQLGHDFSQHFQVSEETTKKSLQNLGHSP
jgi:hypothetical protein